MTQIKQLFNKENFFTIIQTLTIFSLLSVYVLYIDHSRYYNIIWGDYIYVGNSFFDFISIVLFALLYIYYYIKGNKEELSFQENSCNYLVKSFLFALLLKLIIFLYYVFNSG